MKQAANSNEQTQSIIASQQDQINDLENQLIELKKVNASLFEHILSSSETTDTQPHSTLSHSLQQHEQTKSQKRKVRFSEKITVVEPAIYRTDRTNDSIELRNQITQLKSENTKLKIQYRETQDCNEKMREVIGKYSKSKELNELICLLARQNRHPSDSNSKTSKVKLEHDNNFNPALNSTSHDKSSGGNENFSSTQIRWSTNWPEYQTDVTPQYQEIIDKIKNQLISHKNSSHEPEQAVDQFTHDIAKRYWSTVNRTLLNYCETARSSFIYWKPSALSDFDTGELLCLLTILFKDQIDKLHKRLGSHDEKKHDHQYDYIQTTMHILMKLLYDALRFIGRTQTYHYHSILRFLNMVLPELEYLLSRYLPTMNNDVKKRCLSVLWPIYFEDIVYLVKLLKMVSFLDNTNQAYFNEVMLLITNLTKEQSILSQLSMVDELNKLKALYERKQSRVTGHIDIFILIMKAKDTAFVRTCQTEIDILLEDLKHTLSKLKNQRIEQLSLILKKQREFDEKSSAVDSQSSVTREHISILILKIFSFSKLINKSDDHLIVKKLLDETLGICTANATSKSCRYHPTLAIMNKNEHVNRPLKRIELLTIFFFNNLKKTPFAITDRGIGISVISLLNFITCIRCLQEGLYLLTQIEESYYLQMFQFLNKTSQALEPNKLNAFYNDFFSIRTTLVIFNKKEKIKHPLRHYLSWDELENKNQVILSLIETQSKKNDVEYREPLTQFIKALYSKPRLCQLLTLASQKVQIDPRYQVSKSKQQSFFTEDNKSLSPLLDRIKEINTHQSSKKNT